MILPMRMIGRFDLYVIDFVKNIGWISSLKSDFIWTILNKFIDSSTIHLIVLFLISISFIGALILMLWSIENYSYESLKMLIFDGFSHSWITTSSRILILILNGSVNCWSPTEFEVLILRIWCSSVGIVVILLLVSYFVLIQYIHYY
jgi:hypothetical protein